MDGHSDQNILGTVVQVVMTAVSPDGLKPSRLEGLDRVFASDARQTGQSAAGSISTGISTGIGLPRSFKASM